MIELRGVRSSCATDEKNIDLSFFAYFSNALMLVISVPIAIT